MFNTCSNSYAEGSERFKLRAYGPIEPRSPLTWKFSQNREFSPQSTPCRGRLLKTKHSDNIRERTSPAHDDAMDIGYTRGLTLTLISVTLGDSHWLWYVTLMDSQWLWYRLHSGTLTDSDIGYTQGLTPTLISVTLRDTYWLIDWLTVMCHLKGVPQKWRLFSYFTYHTHY